jgi:hypothetical protein
MVPLVRGTTHQVTKLTSTHDVKDQHNSKSHLDDLRKKQVRIVIVALSCNTSTLQTRASNEKDDATSQRVGCGGRPRRRAAARPAVGRAVAPRLSKTLLRLVSETYKTPNEPTKSPD